MPKELETPAAPATETEEEVKQPGQDETEGKSADPEGESEHEEAEQKKKTGGFQKRIAKLSTRASQAEQERDYWRQQALRQPEPAKSEPAKAVVEEDPRPKRAEYENREVGDYVDDVADWAARKAARDARAEALKEFESRNKASQEKSEFQKVVDRYKEAENVVRTKYEDYDEAIAEADNAIRNAGIQVTDGFKEALLTSDGAAEVTYYLSKNPDELIRIAKLGPIAAAREIGKIEARIAPEESASEVEEPEKEEKEPIPITPAVPLSKASPPTTPIKKSSPIDKGLSDNLETDEWMKRRTAEIAKR